MRVLQLINSLNTGGAEKLVTDLAPLIASAYGYECDVMVLGSFKDTVFAQILTDQGVNIIYLNCAREYSLLAPIRIAKYLKFYDVVHTHLFPSQFLAVLAKIISGQKTKLITTEHSTNNRRRKCNFFRITDRFFYKFYDAVISISDDAQRSILKWLSPADRRKYSLILNGVDIKKIDDAKPIKRSQIGIGQDDVLIMCVGRLEAVKNHSMQIKALARLTDNFRLVLVGDGSLKSALQEYARELNVSSRVFFLGIRSDVPSLIRAADIIILTSHWEGLPLACIEGMACCPFIGTNVNGIAEVLSSAGILVNDNDSEELSNQILRLIKDKELYEQIKESCRRRAEQFEISDTLKQYLQIYSAIHT